MNGKPVRTVKDSFQIYQAFKGGGTVYLDVLRGGQATQVKFNIKR